MWIRRKRYQEMLNDIAVRDGQIIFRDAKIKDQMQGLQSLNRDLDQWEPVANEVRSIMGNFKDQSITVAQSCLNMLKDYRKIKEQELRDDSLDEDA